MSVRLDVLLTDRNLAPSREKAKALIMAGVVYVDGRKVDKAGTAVKEDAAVEVRSNPIPFVSRGGLKLQKALSVFPIDLAGKVCMDIGASTGGFTDCMLQHGASHVFAIDVGYGQLDWKLRTDERVTVMERTNARYMEAKWFPKQPDFASIDVSFISLKLILPPLYSVLENGGQVVALIKPQFEAGREEVGKNGVVRDPVVHRQVIRKVLDFTKEIGFSIKGIDFSPIKGPEGNIEFLMFLEKGPDSMEEDFPEEKISETVTAAHRLAGLHTENA